MNMHQGDSLKKHLKINGISVTDLAERLGMSRQNLYLYFGKQRFDEGFMTQLRKAGIELEKPHANNMASDAGGPFYAIGGDGTKGIPYYDVDATASNMVVFGDNKEMVSGYINIPSFNDCDFYLNVFGNSMYPKFCSGEIVACKRINDLDVIPLGEAYLIVTNEQRMIKYIRRGSRRDEFMLYSEHPEYEPFPIDKKKINSLYIIKGKITKNLI